MYYILYINTPEINRQLFLRLELLNALSFYQTINIVILMHKTSAVNTLFE